MFRCLSPTAHHNLQVHFILLWRPRNARGARTPRRASLSDVVLNFPNSLFQVLKFLDLCLKIPKLGLCSMLLNLGFQGVQASHRHFMQGVVLLQGVLHDIQPMGMLLYLCAKRAQVLSEFTYCVVKFVLLAQHTLHAMLQCLDPGGGWVIPSKRFVGGRCRRLKGCLGMAPSRSHFLVLACEVMIHRESPRSRPTKFRQPIPNPEALSIWGRPFSTTQIPRRRMG